MFVGEDGHVGGSIDRAHVAMLLAETSDEELKAYYRDLLGDSEEGQAADEPEAEPEPAPEPEDLSKLTKAQLVERANAEGITDADSLTKADLVSLLGG